MTEQASIHPDLTLTLDQDGVIRNVVAVEFLARESLDEWRGKRWRDTITPATGPVALKKIEDIPRSGFSSCFEVRQRFPSGLELPMEYTTLHLGESGIIAIGRSIEAIDEFRAPDQIAQEGQERDHRKMRETEIADDPGSGSLASLIERLPESFIVIDNEGLVRAANGAFLDLVQVGAAPAVIGRNLARWMSSPGVDADVLLSLIHENGKLRRFVTRIDGELGQSSMVDISAVGNDAVQPHYFGLLMRETDNASASYAADMNEGAAIEGLADRTLEGIVRISREVIERKAILRALDQCNDNRTAAARHLGLSRQSLHTKLKRYGLERK
jgi:PAS domain-containing protein